MEKATYIASLHRPFNQQLKTTKWVCEYVASKNSKISSSDLQLSFYYYLISQLQKEYLKETPNEFNGLPSDYAVNAIFNYAKTKSKKEFLEEIPLIIKSRTTPLEKQIYSTYKAASYYVNLAKDKFGLINERNKLTDLGRELLSFRSNFFKLSSNEKEFYFKRILEADFHLFITHCLFTKLEKKYSLKKSIGEQLEFIDKFLLIAHFNFTSSSLENYNIVRSYWVETLGVIDNNGNIRKKFITLINEDSRFKELFNQINLMFLDFEKENFKSKNSYLLKKQKFMKIYELNVKSNIIDLGFVNLYDIKKEMHISFEKFQVFLNEFYEFEKNNYNIFFNNTVNSIDRRVRFLIRNRPVIKIKIK